MHDDAENDQRGARSKRSARRLFRERMVRVFAGGILAGGLLGAFAGIGATAGAHADETGAGSSTAAPTATAAPATATPSPQDLTNATPTPSPSPPPTAFRIVYPAAGDFIRSGVVQLTGTWDADPDGAITVFSPIDGNADACHITAGSPGTGTDTNGNQIWTCQVSLPSGTAIELQAAETYAGRDDRLDARVTVDSLSPPVIAGTSSYTGGSIKGTGAEAGAEAYVEASNGSACHFTADADGRWACVLDPLPPSGQYTVQAWQEAVLNDVPRSSSRTNAYPVEVDSDPPAAPVLTSPGGSVTAKPGKRIHFAGTGEENAVVTVTAGSKSGSWELCAATVKDGAWSCEGRTLPAGTYTVVALQRDAALNTGPGSTAISVTYPEKAAAPPAHAAPSAPPADPPAQKPPKPAPSGHHTPAPPQHTSTPAPSPTPPAYTQPHPPDGGSLAPPPAGRPAGPFTETVQLTVGADSLSGWARSLTLALATLLLLVLPAWLLARTLRGWRIPGHRLVLAGRNAPGGERRAPLTPGVSRALRVLALAGAACLIVLSGPAPSGAGYFSLVAAVLAALVVLNGIAVLIPLLVGQDAPLQPRFSPRLLWVVTACALGSRLLELHPALLFGLLFTLPLSEGGSPGRRGPVAAVAVGALAGVGLLAWICVSLAPAPSGSVGAFFSQFAGVLVLCGFGSASVALLPVASLPGRAIFAWSKAVWGGLTVIVDTILFALLVPIGDGRQVTTRTAVLAVLAFGFAAVCLALWLWRRYIAPAAYEQAP